MSRIALALGAVVVVSLVARQLGVGNVLRSDRGLSSVPQAEARAIAVEQQLLCPQCTNKRLDTCEIEICQDMRREIRARLNRGESEQEVLRFFAGRYGDRILAALPTSGFPLWLWGWVVVSVVAVAVAGALWLRGQRRVTPTGAADALAEAEERWLDQLPEQPLSRPGG